ncbi:uncharacterized protein ARMOST_19088 [Armillaria ostoyae]|uniref:Uncharacterized protein n=1 Tax=Armillaria ostoyae TaxID=47428 RepID=A0A284S3N3_ARMOS|nr:uncharacterized protein ARMOST_19088 [Armillaria ostoyae]
MSMSTFIVYVVTNILPIIFPECPYKTPLSSVAYAIIMWILRRFTTVLREITPLTFEFQPETKTLQGLGIYAAQRSHIKHEVDALLWLYVRSSTAAIRRLVIHTLAGLPPEYIQYAEEAFTSHWVEIRDEKERMLMDCMELTRDGSTQWIPKDIPNIDCRIEPLLCLERLFRPSSRKFPFGLFGEHDLDFSRKDISDTLSTTLSSLDDLHIRMPTGLDSQKKVVMNALTDNHIHHPDVWKSLFNHASEQGLFHWEQSSFDLLRQTHKCSVSGNSDLTIDMCLSLVTTIYFPKRDSSTSYSCTLADAAVHHDRKNVLHTLLSFFERSEFDKFNLHPESENYERRLLLAIMHLLVSDSPSIFEPRVSSTHDSTFFRNQLLRIVVHALNKSVHPPAMSLLKFDPEIFKAIASYVASDLFTYSHFRDLECSIVHALVCMASLIHREPHFDILVPPEEWATKSLFLNILNIQQLSYHENFSTYSSAVKFSPFLQKHFGNMEHLGIFLFGQAFSKGILQAYDVFWEQGGLMRTADREYLHPNVLEGFWGYLTGLSKAMKKTGNQSPDPEMFPGWHIQDLHRAVVIRCICASIVHSGTPLRPILSFLASIAPHHPEWSRILDTLNSPDDKYSIEKYNFHWYPSPDDKESLKKDMKDIVRILDECLKVARGPNNDINQSSMRCSPHSGSPEIQHESRWRKFLRKPKNSNTDIELEARDVERG